MDLPKEFKFKPLNDETIFKAVKDSNFDQYNVYNKENMFVTSVSDYWVEIYVVHKHWKIVEEKEPKEMTYNGEDAKGNPKNFTKDDLKVGQRVVTLNGMEWIALPDNGIEGLVLVNECEWNRFYTETENTGIYQDFKVVAVYEQPARHSHLLDPSKKGKLIWKAVEAKPLDPELQKRFDYYQVHIDALKENLESLQKEFEELKEQVA